MPEHGWGPCPKCGQPKRQYVACAHCGYSFLGARVAEKGPPVEVRRASPSEPKVRARSQAPDRVRSNRPRVDRTGPNIRVRGKPVVVYDRGQRVNDSKRCYSCEQFSEPVWRFWETDRGMVYLCQNCKQLARERSTRSDALDHRVPGDFFRG